MRLAINIAIVAGMGLNYKQILDLRLVRIVNLHLCTTQLKVTVFFFLFFF